MKLKNLPIGQSSFERIIKDNELYVDKTKILYELINSTKFNFLSRPRRFGKSLLISTLKNIFLGNEELFKGLWIYNSNWKWEKHPVLVIDFNVITSDTSENLIISLTDKLKEEAKKYNITIKKSLLKSVLEEFICEVYEKTGKNLIILVDEYDKPLINHLGEGEARIEIAKQNREILKELFSTLKGENVISKLRFLLLTGVSKFSKAGVFSALNNLSDLTMNAKYSELLGITEDEVDKYFKGYIEDCADEYGISYEEMREKLREYYNGYRFSEKNLKVYNPYSLINFFNEKKFKNYWFESGTPTFLVNLIKEKNYYIPEAENLQVLEDIFSSYEIEDLDIRALLFQTGYLTIKNYNFKRNIYILSYPNREVKYSFLRYLFKNLTEKRLDNRYIKIGEYLDNGNVEKLIEVIKSIFAGIPYIEGAQLNEANFHTLFYLMIGAGGYPADMEVLTSEGRIDLKVKTEGKIFIMEFKCNQNADKAIEQIKEKKYFEPFLCQNKEIILIGINFDTDKRNISEYRYEKL